MEALRFNRRAWLLAALVILGAAAMRDSQAGWFGPSETKPPYPVTSSGLLFGRGVGNLEPVYWLDNDRAMFGAYAHFPSKETSGNKPSTSAFGIYIWNIKDNTYKRYADLVDAPRLFRYDHGEIAYMIDDPKDGHGTFVAMVGKMGEEKRLTLSGGFGGHPELEPSAGPHKTFRRDEARNFINTYALLPQHGHIYVSTTQSGTAWNGNQNDRVKLYRPQHESPIELPILVKEMDSGAVLGYSDYLNKYVLVPSTWPGRDLKNTNYAWPADEPYLIYLIAPDGQVETIKIPPGLWRPQAAYVTREGLFWVSNNTRKNSRDAGGWLLKDGKVTKLFDQLVDGAGVSPDGCTIVYANNDFNPKTTEYVQAIHLCASPNPR